MPKEKKKGKKKKKTRVFCLLYQGRPPGDMGWNRVLFSALSEIFSNIYRPHNLS